jgi:hypothetical protein
VVEDMLESLGERGSNLVNPAVPVSHSATIWMVSEYFGRKKLSKGIHNSHHGYLLPTSQRKRTGIQDACAPD